MESNKMVYWTDNYKILFMNYLEFVPNNGMNNIEKCNALVRFSIYLLLIFIIFGRTNNWLYLPLFIFLLSMILCWIDKNDTKPIKELCQKPTYTNPYMNVLQSDYAYNVNKKPAC